MNKTMMAATLMFLLTAAPAMAQMMGGGPQIMGQQGQQAPQQQNYPYQMYPGMMGGYGYGMGPGMMGGYGGWGYGMGPGMMGGYGGWGYGMGPGMMGRYGGYGYGMGPGMMGRWGANPPCAGWQGPCFKSNEDYAKFLDATREQRKKLNSLMFEYNEEMFSPNPDKNKLAKMEEEMNELRSEIYSQKMK